MGPSRGRLLRISALACCGLLLAPAIASAAAIYDASTGLGPHETAGATVTSTGFLSIPYPGGTGTIMHQEFAAAGPGGLRASARADVDVSSIAVLYAPSGGAFATAALSFDDLLITGPTRGTVPGSLNLNLDGTFATSAILNGILIWGLGSSVSVIVDGTLDGNSFQGAFDQTQGLRVNMFTGEKTTTTVANHSGIFGAGPVLPVTPVTPVFDLPVGVPFDLTLRLTVTASWGAEVVGTAGGANAPSFQIFSLSDFSNTLTLAQTGPVFNLASGYSVDSAQAGIQNNRIVSANPIPEPETYAMLLAGLGLLGFAARRRKLKEAAAA